MINNNNNNKHKKGFTLVELMVFFVFLSLILAASMPVITKRISNIPQRVFHGSFICTRDVNGDYIGTYYNSSGQLIRRNQTSDSDCGFRAPRNIPYYQIILIGAGAGGTNPTTTNTLITNDTSDSKGEYNIPQNPGDNPVFFTGDDSTQLNGKQLKYILNHADITFKLVQPTGDAEKGDNITKTFSKFVERKCKDPQKNQCGWKLSTVPWDNFLISSEPEQIFLVLADFRLQEKYPQYLIANNATTNWVDAYKTWIGRTVNISQPKDAIDISTEPIKYTAKGSNRGLGAYIDYQNWIDFKNDDNTPVDVNDDKAVQKYIQSLFTEKYVTGYNYNTDCKLENISQEIPENNEEDPIRMDYYNKFQKAVSEITNQSLELIKDENIYHNNMGKSVKFYGVIKAKNKCYRNTIRATGGYPGLIYADAEPNIISGGFTIPGATWQIQQFRPREAFIIILDANKAGKNADGINAQPGAGEGTIKIINADEYGSYIRYKYEQRFHRTVKPQKIEINTTLNRRQHRVGIAGKPGELREYYATSLQNCVFGIHPGGDPSFTSNGTGRLAESGDILNTTLSCNSDNSRINYSANGGIVLAAELSELKTLVDGQNASDVETDSTLDNLNGNVECIAKYPLVKYFNLRTKTPNIQKIETFNQGDIINDINKTRFIRANNVDFTRFGIGGDSNHIIDHAVIPYGEYRTAIVYSDSTRIHRTNFNLPFIRQETENIPAQRGGTGAVIISW